MQHVNRGRASLLISRLRGSQFLSHIDHSCSSSSSFYSLRQTNKYFRETHVKILFTTEIPCRVDKTVPHMKKKQRVGSAQVLQITLCGQHSQTARLFLDSFALVHYYLKSSEFPLLEIKRLKMQILVKWGNYARLKMSKVKMQKS